MAGPAVKSSGVIVPRPLKWHGRLSAFLIACFIRLLSATVRFRPADSFTIHGSVLEKPVIFCIWHNRLALCLMLYQRYVARLHSGRRLAAMVSASRDGGMLARILDHFGVQPVRGSSSRRGPQALLELTSWAERGYDLAITPDGPRGPRYIVQDGVVALAQLTGLPVVPVTYRLSWKYCLRSWDRFQVPLPFSLCEWQLGNVIRVPREVTDAEREVLRQELEKAMLGITRD
jgi:lysophospholipid acyltransferase (LPLAT)-like uncharacterized protein